MTPCELQILLHYYVSPELYEYRDAPAVRDFTQSFVFREILRPKGDVYELTDLGLYWLRSILNTPVPKIVYVDPRTHEAIGTDGI